METVCLKSVWWSSKTSIQPCYLNRELKWPLRVGKPRVSPTTATNAGMIRTTGGNVLEPSCRFAEHELNGYLTQFHPVRSRFTSVVVKESNHKAHSRIPSYWGVRLKTYSPVMNNIFRFLMAKLNLAQNKYEGLSCSITVTNATARTYKCGTISLVGY